MIYALAFVSLSGAPALAAEKTAQQLYDSAIRHFFKREYAQAIPELKKVAAMPEPSDKGAAVACLPDQPCIFAAGPENVPRDASCLLGDMYALGLGVSRDMTAAAKGWRLPMDKYPALLAAAEKGDARAQVALGDLYKYSPCLWGIDPHDHTVLTNQRSLTRDEAVSWFQKAAEAGNTDGAGRLGDFSDDWARALEWYGKAAAGGAPEWEYKYGVELRAHGRYAEGLSWLRKAEAQGYQPASNYLNEGRAMQIPEGSGYEFLDDLEILVLIALIAYGIRKKKPFRVTLEGLGKALIYLLVVVVTVEILADIPGFSEAVDHAFMYLLRARLYLPDAISDSVHVLVALTMLACAAFVGVVVLVTRLVMGEVGRLFTVEQVRKK